jgi:hypothetical protein
MPCNPATLAELADSLAMSAAAAIDRAHEHHAAGRTFSTNYEMGYRAALLDTRATVLAMVAAEPAYRPDGTRDLSAAIFGTPESRDAAR